MAPTRPEHMTFAPELADTMGKAFEMAWAALEGAGSRHVGADQAEATREAIALRIIELAKAGEHTAEGLSRGAIDHVRDGRAGLDGRGGDDPQA